MIGAIDRSATLPAALRWAYQDALNRGADLLFWQETHYKPNQRLDPADPQDREMIPRWWAARARIEQISSPREMIRERAVEKALAAHRDDPSLVFVHSAAAGGSQMRAFPARRDKRVEDYVRARLRDSSYVAIFDAGDPQWPQPIFERYPQDDQSPPNVSGAMLEGHYFRPRGRGEYGK